MGKLKSIDFERCTSGIEFEDWTKDLLRDLSFNADRVGKNDSGVDIIAKAQWNGKVLAYGEKVLPNDATPIFSSDDLNECISFMSWLKTRFVRFFVAINISKLAPMLCDECFKLVPYPIVLDADGNRVIGKFDHIYTDAELYEAFNLPQKYIDVIEAIIKERK